MSSVIHSLLHEQFQYVRLLNKNHKTTLNWYTTASNSGYRNLNHHLRHHESLHPAEQSHYANLIMAFQNTPRLMHPITLYRGVHDIPISTHLHAPGVSSCTYDILVARSFAKPSCCILEILLSPGNFSVLPLEEVSNKPEEKEILLPPGIFILENKTQYNSYTLLKTKFIPLKL